MNPRFARNSVARCGFTLIELLVVFAIISLLAAMILAAISAGKTRTKIAMTRTQLGRIDLALTGYQSLYGQLPVSSQAKTAAIANGGSFTYGGTYQDAAGNPLLIGTPGYAANNSEVMSVLLDVESFAGTPTINVGHIKNQKGEKFLRDVLVSARDPGGVGDDGVFRDYFGSPYVISLNLDEGGRCADALYRRQSVSQTTVGSATGFDGLMNATANPNSDSFSSAGRFMIWSVGPDKKADPGTKANAGVNKDNIIGWR